MKKTTQCSWCNKDFYPKAKTSICCSRSCAAKKRMSDPQYKSNLKKSHLTETARNNHSNAAKKTMSVSEERERRSASFKKTMQDPDRKKNWLSKAQSKEAREKRSQSLKKAWKNDALRAKMLSGLNAYFTKEVCEQRKLFLSQQHIRDLNAVSISKSLRDPNVQRKIYETKKMKGTENNWHNAVMATVTSPEGQKRIYDTKVKNMSFISSSLEKKAHSLLCEKYGADNVEWQYRDEGRYPFTCDFYIKPTDTFIECNFSWTHGYAPYNPNDPKHQARLSEWKNRSQETHFSGAGKKEYYKNAITTWTERDVRKRKTAENNKLNYVIFYALKELEQWVKD